jgi:DivIVA domain-containing protein
MIDERFQFMPIDVRKAEFPNAMRGYDKNAVETFRERVYEALEQQTRLNQDLETKAKNFHEQLRAFRERDKALNEALVAAQQLRTEIREQAEREAQLIVREAQAEAERIVDGARAGARDLRGEIEALERMRRAYLAQFRALVERQMAEIEAAETVAPLTPVAPAQPNGEPRGRHHPTPSWLDTLVKE